MTMYENVINDLKDIRGKEVSIFGQKTTLSNTCSKYVVDAINVVEGLKNGGYIMEVEDMQEELNDLEINCDLDKIDSIENFIDLLIDKGVIDNNKTKSDNTYNVNGNVSNDMYIHIYTNDYNECVYTVIAFNRYGDVRGNYTDELLLKFNSEYDCMDYFLGYDDFSCCVLNTITINGKEYETTSNIFSESIQVYSLEKMDDIGEVYGYYESDEEIIEEIKEKLLNDK